VCGEQYKTEHNVENDLKSRLARNFSQHIAYYKTNILTRLCSSLEFLDKWTRHRASTGTRWNFAFGAMLS